MNGFLFDIVVCPVCKGKLCYNQDKKELLCKIDKILFPIRDGIPVLLKNEAYDFISK